MRLEKDQCREAAAARREEATTRSKLLNDKKNLGSAVRAHELGVFERVRPTKLSPGYKLG